MYQIAVRLAAMADKLDEMGLYNEADIVTASLNRIASDEDPMVGKILKLLEKEGVKCPECGGEMDMEDGLCNCGDDDCDCTIDMKDEIEEFLHRIGIGNIDCPECKGTLEMKGMHCVCKDSKCKCKKHVKETLLDNLYHGVDFTKMSMKHRTAAKKPGNVKLNKPFRTPGGPKKFAVYVKNDKGNIVKVNFGSPDMEIKRDDPNRRKNFRARHNCDSPGPRTKARYWSCRNWESGRSVSDNLKGK
jgi:hypothetical protein